MTITRPQVSSPEDIEKLVEAAVRRGANIQMSDPRMTALQTWFLGVIGITAIGTGGWLIKSVNDQTVQLAQLVERMENVQREHNRLELRFENHVNSVVKPAREQP